MLDEDGEVSESERLRLKFMLYNKTTVNLLSSLILWRAFVYSKLKVDDGHT